MAKPNVIAKIQISFSGNQNWKLRILRKKVHVGISAVLVLVILVFNAINNESVISAIFRIAGYTYGPLLGMYTFGLFTKFKTKDKYVPWIAIISPIICFFLSSYSEILFSGYQFGFELLIVNGLITFTGMFIFRKTEKIEEHL